VLFGPAQRRARPLSQGRSHRHQLSECERGQNQQRWPMMKYSLKETEPAETPPEAVEREDYIAPAPRVSVQAFCATAETAASVQAAAEDRRMTKAHLRVQMGGVAAAAEAYRSSPTPNVILLESDTRGEDILTGLDEL